MKKQVYLDRRWQLCDFLWSKGDVAGVNLEGIEHVVDIRHIRDVAAQCIECDRYILRMSYQTHAGTSVCSSCYEKLNRDHLNLYFGGPQWMSWEGQISIKNMDTKHIIACIGMLKKRAEEAQKLIGGEVVLGQHFEYLVEELHARTPPKERAVMNPFLLYIYTFLMVLNGYWNQKSAEESDESESGGVPLGLRISDADRAGEGGSKKTVGAEGENQQAGRIHNAW